MQSMVADESESASYDLMGFVAEGMKLEHKNMTRAQDAIVQILRQAAAKGMRTLVVGRASAMANVSGAEVQRALYRLEDEGRVATDEDGYYKLA